MDMAEIHREDTEAQLRALIREEIVREPLNEFSLPFAKGSAKNLIQLIVASAAEYGIALGTAGTAAPIAPVVETAIDALFGIEEVASGISAVQGVVSSASEMGQLLNSAKQSAQKFSTNPKAFYSDVQVAVKKIADMGASSSLDEIKEQIEKLINEITGPLTAALKMIIPDAALGALASQTVLTAVQSLGTRPYDVMSSIVKKLGKFGRFITDPNAIKGFFDKNLPDLVELLQKLTAKLRENTSFLKNSIKTSLLANGPEVFEKVANDLAEKQPEIMKVMDSIVDTLIPAVLGLIAAYQSIATGDYKNNSTSEKKDNKDLTTSVEASSTVTPAAVSELRSIDRELDRINIFLESFQGHRLRHSL